MGTTGNIAIDRNLITRAETSLRTLTTEIANFKGLDMIKDGLPRIEEVTVDDANDCFGVKLKTNTETARNAIVKKLDEQSSSMSHLAEALHFMLMDWDAVEEANRGTADFYNHCWEDAKKKLDRTV